MKDFIDSATFISLMENIMREKSISHIEAILEICRVKNMEPESVPELLTPKIRKLIQNEAASMNMMKKKTTRRLPI